MKKLALAALMAGTAMAAGSTAHAATTIDFTAMPMYTPVASFSGVTVSLYGGNASGTAVIGTFDEALLGNSTTGEYPTSQGILFGFSSAVSSLSFTFNNFGDNDDLGMPSFLRAFAGAVETDYQNLSTSACQEDLCTINVAGSNITRLYVDNGTEGLDNWHFGIGQMSFETASTGAVPEPASWAMMIAGFGIAGAAMRRRQVVRVSFG
jgi:hypothetical protein